MKYMLKFEGEDRLTLNDVVKSIGTLVREPNIKIAKKKFIEAIQYDGVLCQIKNTIELLDAAGKFENLKKDRNGKSKNV